MKILATSRWPIRLVGLAVGCLLLGGCQPSTAPAPAPVVTTTSGGGWNFENITEQSGVRCRYENGRSAGHYAILESLGGGVGLLDLDRDGLLDLLFPGGGQFQGHERVEIVGLPMSCFRGLGENRWRDISLVSGLAEPHQYSHGVAIADYDNDGFDDVAVTGYGGVTLWSNMGDGTFESLDPSCGLTDDLWSSSAGWGDLDGDGNLDLYLAHYVDWSLANNPACPSPSPSHPRDICPPRKFNGLDDRVFRNAGDGTFRDASKEWGLVPQGKGLGVVLADVDDDADTDIYVANDTVNNFLYINEGNGSLAESGLQSGTAVDFQGKPTGSMGVEFFDYDQDSKGDLWVTNFEQETFSLYHNLGDRQFLDVSRDTGISAVGDLFVGFGTVAKDLDGDGDIDLAIANGHVIYYPNKAPFEQQSLVLENVGPLGFQRVKFPEESFFSKRFPSRGLAAGDLDRDGLTDLVVSTLNSAPQILRNATLAKGQRIRMVLSGTRANRSAIGTRVVLKTSLGDRVGWLNGGGSYLSASELVCDFFVPSNEAACTAIIHWPYGPAQPSGPLEPGMDYAIWEQPGHGESRTLSLRSASLQSTQ